MNSKCLTIGYAVAHSRGVTSTTQLNYNLLTHQYTFVISKFQNGKSRSYARNMGNEIDRHLLHLSRLPRAQHIGKLDMDIVFKVDDRPRKVRIIPDRAIPGNMIIDAGRDGTVTWINVANNPATAILVAIATAMDVSVSASMSEGGGNVGGGVTGEGGLFGGSACAQVELCGYTFEVCIEWGSA